MNSELFFRRIEPWKADTYETQKLASSHTRRGYMNYRAIYNTIVDCSKVKWKNGDLVVFDSAYHDYHLRNNWQYWYYNEQDKENYIKSNGSRNSKIPLYAGNETGIIIGRYKWTKIKHYHTFVDYGTVIMMLTGSSIGRIRRYFASFPWRLKDRFPYSYSNDEIFQGIEPLDDINIFLQKLTDELGALRPYANR